jgi:hypothetical protein
MSLRLFVANFNIVLEYEQVTLLEIIKMKVVNKLIERA